jgi:hypothetical protein
MAEQARFSEAMRIPLGRSNGETELFVDMVGSKGCDHKCDAGKKRAFRKSQEE